MKRQTKIRIAQMAALLGALPVLVWAYSYGPPPGFTTAPGDEPGIACTYCHGGSLNGGGGTVKINFPNGQTYTPGQTQTMTIVVTDSQAQFYGFQMTARLDSNPSSTQAGNFTPLQQSGGLQQVICAQYDIAPASGCPSSEYNGLEWIEHSQQPFTSNQIQVQWAPPATNQGNVHIYVAVNAAPINGGYATGHIYAADYVLTPNGGTPAPSGNPPTVSAVVNGANFVKSIQAGSFVSIFGTQLSTQSMSWDGSINNGVFPLTLGGASVTIDGNPAPVNYVSPGQVNVLAPADTNVGPVSVTVTTSGGTSNSFTALLVNESPAFFTYGPDNGRYIAAQIGLVGNKTLTLAPVGLFGANVPSQPIQAGQVAVLYGTGFGPTNPLEDPTHVLSSALVCANQPTVTIGGVQAAVQFCGITETGLYQINVTLPGGLASGDQPVVATTNGVQTSQAVYIPVQ